VNKKIIGISIGIAIIIAVTGAILTISGPGSISTQNHNTKVGLVINSPSQSVSLQQIDKIFSDASSTGIGRGNVYLFWNIVEPHQGEFDWKQSDILMGLNKKNDLKVTLFFSIINGNTLGPFPDWMGHPSIDTINQERLVNVLDAILSRYNIIDSVIIAGETESQFRYNEQDIPAYKELFSGVYEKLKAKHPDVKFGNSFALHNVLNKDLEPIVSDLAIGDFVAFSYFPVDSLNEIIKNPQEAKEDLQEIFKIIPNKKISLFEISWSTSDFVGGSTTSQKNFLDKLFEFYSENKSKIEFMTWYRQYDRPEGTCSAAQQKIGNENVNLEGGSILGSNEYTVKRLNHYVCNAGLVDVDGNTKPGWNEFKNQIATLN
jgi:hypothetical protein